MAQVSPTGTLSPLDRADGSASYSRNGYSVIGGVNGPVEVQRRDELPEEAAIDVAIRPVSGVAGVRERHLESVLQNTLRQVILVSAHPRTLIQITVQVLASPEDESVVSGLPQAASSIDILPALFQTAMLALLSTSIPLAMTMTSTLTAIDPQGGLLPNPSARGLSTASSVHVLAFSSLGDLLVVESEGHFSLDTWEKVYTHARRMCLGYEEKEDGGEDVGMEELEEQDEQDEQDEQGVTSLHDALRSAVQTKFEKDLKWKESLG
ncbi:MAG: hypothetical protein Q9217_002439 [Psora testacea]